MAFLTAAFKGAHCVPAEVIAASVILLAFVDVWVRKYTNEKIDRPSALTVVYAHLHLMLNGQKQQVAKKQVLYFWCCAHANSAHFCHFYVSIYFCPFIFK